MLRYTLLRPLSSSTVDQIAHRACLPAVPRKCHLYPLHCPSYRLSPPPSDLSAPQLRPGKARLHLALADTGRRRRRRRGLLGRRRRLGLLSRHAAGGRRVRRAARTARWRAGRLERRLGRAARGGPHRLAGAAPQEDGRPAHQHGKQRGVERRGEEGRCWAERLVSTAEQRPLFLSTHLGWRRNHS